MRLTRKLNRIDSEVRNASLNSNFRDKSSGPLNIGTFEERAVMIHHKSVADMEFFFLFIVLE